MQGVAQPQCSLPFPLAFLPESKTGSFNGRSSGSFKLLRLPGAIPVTSYKSIVSELTAAGTAPDLNRIPF